MKLGLLIVGISLGLLMFSAENLLAASMQNRLEKMRRASAPSLSLRPESSERTRRFSLFSPRSSTGEAARRSRVRTSTPGTPLLNHLDTLFSMDLDGVKVHPLSRRSLNSLVSSIGSTPSSTMKNRIRFEGLYSFETFPKAPVVPQGSSASLPVKSKRKFFIKE